MSLTFVSLIYNHDDMNKHFFLLVSTMLVVFSVFSQSNAIDTKCPLQASIQDKIADSLKSIQTVGLAIDLLPPVLSATAGSFGYSAQVWYGYKKFRIRGVIAGFTMPDNMMGNDDFENLRTDAVALIFDYFLKNNFKGWWLGAGFEMWNTTITYKMNYQNYEFTDYVATAGSGYIFSVYRNFYVEPWGALHYTLNNEKVTIGNVSFKTKKIQGEVSLKVGWHL